MGIKEVLAIDKEEPDSGINRMIFPLSEIKNAINDGIVVSHMLVSIYSQNIGGVDSKNVYCFFRNSKTEMVGGSFRFDNYYLRLGIVLGELIEFLNEGEEVDQIVLFTKT